MGFCFNFFKTLKLEIHQRTKCSQRTKTLNFLIVITHRKVKTSCAWSRGQLHDLWVPGRFEYSQIPSSGHPRQISQVHRNSIVSYHQWPPLLEKRSDGGGQTGFQLRFDKLSQRHEHWIEHWKRIQMLNKC